MGLFVGQMLIVLKDGKSWVFIMSVWKEFSIGR